MAQPDAAARRFLENCRQDRRATDEVLDLLERALDRLDADPAEQRRRRDDALQRLVSTIAEYVPEGRGRQAAIVRAVVAEIDRATRSKTAVDDLATLARAAFGKRRVDADMASTVRDVARHVLATLRTKIARDFVE